MLTIGLTGGIGSGKSVVADAFAERGVPVIDTDRIARELVEPGQPALAAIVERFGPDILDPTGHLDRAALRERVFRDDAERQALEAILHPAIREEVLRRIDGLNAAYCLIVIPLLAETRGYEWLDRVLVVDVPETVQIERVMERDGLSREAAERILRSQADRKDRLAIADDVIRNTASLEELHAEVARLHDRYLNMASEAAGD